MNGSQSCPRGEEGICPFDEGEVTLKIFPIEIWEQIFEHVEGVEDLRTICKTYGIWEDVLSRTKQAWLFVHIFPHIWPLISKKEILRCRHVCRRWTTAVDYFLENHEFHKPADEASNHLRRRPLIRGLRDFGVLYTHYNLPRMEKMAQVAPTHPRNPIIGRSVYVEWERVPQKYLAFFQTFGKHIWYLRVQCTQREVKPIPFVLRIFDYLVHLPNLKKLELFLWEAHHGGGGGGSVSNCSSNEDHDWETYLNRLPMDQFPTLHTLELEIMGKHHETVKRILMTTFGSQIKRLAINRYTLTTTPPLQNLTDLSMTADTRAHLECLLVLDCPYLTRLAISVVYPQNYPLAFRAIDHFKGTVRVLAIDFQSPITFAEWRRLKFPKLELPHVKTLALKGRIPPSLNFICDLASLQYLHICDLRSNALVAILDSKTVVDQEKVQILEYLNKPASLLKTGDVYQSNLWRVFPKLREFTFTNFMRRTPDVERRYRRDHYDRWQQKIAQEYEDLL